MNSRFTRRVTIFTLLVDEARVLLSAGAPAGDLSMLTYRCKRYVTGQESGYDGLIVALPLPRHAFDRLVSAWEPADCLLMVQKMVCHEDYVQAGKAMTFDGKTPIPDVWDLPDAPGTQQTGARMSVIARSVDVEALKCDILALQLLGILMAPYLPGEHSDCGVNVQDVVDQM
jgi:hypothetical protein